jgi:mitosis inhibitor protein kinase SWE1
VCKSLTWSFADST